MKMRIDDDKKNDLKMNFNANLKIEKFITVFKNSKNICYKFLNILKFLRNSKLIKFLFSKRRRSKSFSTSIDMMIKKKK